MAEEESQDFTRCPDCGKMTLEKLGTTHGLFCCLGLWWVCGLGCLCYRCLSEDFCEPCDTMNMLVHAKDKRQLQLFLDDRSIYDQPQIDEAVKEAHIKDILIERSKYE